MSKVTLSNDEQNVLEQLLIGLEDLYKVEKEKFKNITIKGFFTSPIETFTYTYATIKAVIYGVEFLVQQYDNVPSYVKKQAAVEFLNKHIDIKIVFFTEEKEEIVFGLLVDAFVAIENASQGKVWYKDALDKFGQIFEQLKKIFK